MKALDLLYQNIIINYKWFAFSKESTFKCCNRCILLWNTVFRINKPHYLCWHIMRVISSPERKWRNKPLPAIERATEQNSAQGTAGRSNSNAIRNSCDEVWIGFSEAPFLLSSQMTQATRSENIATMAIFHRYSCRWRPTISRARRLQHRCTAKRFQAFQHAKSTWKESTGTRHLPHIYPPSTYPDGMPKTSPGPRSRAGGLGGYEGHHVAVSKARAVLRKHVQADIKNWHIQQVKCILVENKNFKKLHRKQLLTKLRKRECTTLIVNEVLYDDLHIFAKTAQTNPRKGLWLWTAISAKDMARSFRYNVPANSRCCKTNVSQWKRSICFIKTLSLTTNGLLFSKESTFKSCNRCILLWNTDKQCI